MFNSLRKLFGRRVESTVDTPSEHRAPATPRLTLAPGFTPRSARADLQPRNGAAVPANAPTSLTIPLKSIIDRLPADLMQRVRQVEVGEAVVSVSMQKVLSQIAQGAVKLSFGELRQVSPPGTFSLENDLDRSLVDLPLHEVIARMNLALLPRRPVQKQVEVPPEVTGPFGGQCKLAISTTPLKPVPPTQPPSRAQEPPPRIQPPPAAPVQPAPRSQPIVARVRSVTSAQPAPHVEPEPRPAPLLDVQEPVFNPVFNRIGSVTPPSPAPKQVFTPIAPEPTPAPSSTPSAAIPMSDVFRKSPSAAPITPIAPVTESEPAPIRFTPPAPAPAPAPVAPPQPVITADTRFLTVAIAEVTASWPEAVKDEIVALKASTSSIGLPLSAVEVALKYGKVAFPWKALRSWIKPPVAASLSASDGTVLELPLKVVAPLFLAELKSGKPQAKITVDKEIPDLFFDGTRSSEAPSHAPAAAPIPPAPASTAAAHVPPPAPVEHVAPRLPAAPVVPSAPAVSSPAPAKAHTEDTNFFNRKDKVEEKVEEPEDKVVFLKKDGTPGTAFLKRYATPNEIVNKAAGLPNVDGALIALPDGLLVASRIPATMNADTVAAFLPQIFGKVSQCTRELRLGDLNNLNFTVGNIPWKIFKVGAIYFAAFGRAGEAMPTAQLAGLAAELDHQAK